MDRKWGSMFDDVASLLTRLVEGVANGQWFSLPTLLSARRYIHQGSRIPRRYGDNPSLFSFKGRTSPLLDGVGVSRR